MTMIKVERGDVCLGNSEALSSEAGFERKDDYVKSIGWLHLLLFTSLGVLLANGNGIDATPV